jgi:hypothetical protein
MFGDDFKSKLDTEWEEYQEKNPTQSYTTNDRFNFHNKKMQEWYDKSDPEVKKQVEEFRLQYKQGLGDDVEDPNSVLQK